MHLQFFILFDKIICFFKIKGYFCRNINQYLYTMGTIRKEIYLNEADARRHAESFAEEIGGHLHLDIASVSNDTKFDYVSRDCADLSWAGEAPAFQVIGADYNLVALFGYLEEE